MKVEEFSIINSQVSIICSNVIVQKKSKVLIAGIGNIFHGDDAFGCEVVKKLGELDLPDHVEARDFGIRGFDLAFSIALPYELVILVDCIRAGTAPGTLIVMEPRIGLADKLESHPVTPASALEIAAHFPEKADRVVIVGCEPETSGFGDEMSDAVRRGVERAVGKVLELCRKV